MQKTTTLDLCAIGQNLEVLGVSAGDVPEWAMWLEEIGFSAGERCTILHQALGQGPIAVRVGSSLFALRQAEARCVRVRTLD